jgi:hypothetical protein
LCAGLFKTRNKRNFVSIALSSFLGLAEKKSTFLFEKRKAGQKKLQKVSFFDFFCASFLFPERKDTIKVEVYDQQY